MFNRPIPFYYVLLSSIVCCVVTGVILTAFVYRPESDASKKASASARPTITCGVDEPRLSGYKYIRPLLSVEGECEADRYQPIKSAVADQIQSLRASDIITTASVYVKDFEHGDWFALNDQEKYLPGSMMKLPTLMTYMRMYEVSPGILDKSLLLDKPYTAKTTTFKSKTLEPGHTYTVRDLLHAMIAYSDNNASTLLGNNMDLQAFQKTFTDLGLPPVNLTTAVNYFSAREFSVFLKVLYNASYLNIANSEYATGLLTESDFRQGIAAGLPPDIRIAHKFGEAGDKTSLYLSETAIVYASNTPYEITVMCKGSDFIRMTQALSSISHIVYDRMTKLSASPL